MKTCNNCDEAINNMCVLVNGEPRKLPASVPKWVRHHLLRTDLSYSYLYKTKINTQKLYLYLHKFISQEGLAEKLEATLSTWIGNEQLKSEIIHSVWDNDLLEWVNQHLECED